LSGNHKSAAPMMLIAIVLGILFWILDGFLHALLTEHVDFIEAILSPEPSVISRRLIFFILLILSGIYIRTRFPKQ